MINQPTPEEARMLMPLAIGKFLRMLWRGWEEPGDVAAFHECRDVVLTYGEVLGMDTTEGYQTNWARDRLHGAQGG